MGWGRAVSSLTASGVVAGCALLAVGMGRAADKPAADKATPAHSTAAPTSRPATPEIGDDVPQVAVAPGTPTRAAVTSRPPAPHTTTAPVADGPTSRPIAAAAPRPTVTAAPRPAATHPVVRQSAAVRPAAPVAHPSPQVTHAAPPAVARGGSLPLHYATYSATKVVTVVASHTWSTTARLQAWTRAPGGGWYRSGAEWTAHVGSEGLTSSPSEYRSATPIGSFSVTRSFGRYSDPGTSLPYHKVDSSDYWISHPGPTYNTMQHCTTSSCHTDADEHLIGVDPQYNYAAVINYNTTARVYPRGSAFFLHVSDGGSTAGCVSVAQAKVISLLRWLTPASHPRILIGIA